jgi:hypothetical protein
LLQTMGDRLAKLDEEELGLVVQFVESAVNMLIKRR